MTVKTSALTQTHTKLLSTFLQTRKNAEDGVRAYAGAYKACVDAGMDLSTYVTHQEGTRLLKVAAGGLYEVSLLRLLTIPEAGLDVLAGLPKEQQKDLWDSGAEIVHGRRKETVPLESLTAKHFKQFVDPKSKRILTGSEQIARRGPRGDQTITLVMTDVEWKAANDRAIELGKGLPMYIIGLIHADTGAAKPKHVFRREQKVATKRKSA